MAYTPYSTQQLAGFYGIIDKVNPFLFDTFFKPTVLFDNAQVGIDKSQRSRRLAPLADTALGQGSSDSVPTYTTSLYSPARVKIRAAVDPAMTLVRRAGEQFNGTDMSPEQRRDLIVMSMLRQQDEEISRREEFMAMQALVTGFVTVRGEGTANPQVLDMARPASHSITLTGSATWATPGVDPLQMLNTWSAIVQKDSGYLPTVVVMDPVAYNLFLHSPGVTEIMTYFNQQSGYLNIAGYPVGGVGNEAALQGKVGKFEIWSYQSFYTDDFGNVQQMLPDNTVIMGNPQGAGGQRLYGAILDTAGLTPVRRFPSMWYSPDAGMEYIQTQSSPLVTLGWAQATFTAKVA